MLWSGRPLPLSPAWWRGERYAVTDFRLVVRQGVALRELAAHEIAGVDLHQARLARWIDRSDVTILAAGGAEPVVFASVRRGAELVAILHLLAPRPSADEIAHALARAAGETLARGPLTRSLVRTRVALSGAALAGLVLLAGGIRLRGEAVIGYPPNDAIYPGGHKRSRAEIVAFMTQEVMPFARKALRPIVGDVSRVTCFTCHGLDAETRDWKMPAVAALPEPDVRAAGLERYAHTTDAWLRNAVYGELAESENQRTAGYMRRVVMPGMARLLGRPAYDFTKPYRDNRSRFTFGCYHCHRVN